MRRESNKTITKEGHWKVARFILRKPNKIVEFDKNVCVNNT